jgi:hypothetical protein
MKVTYQNQALFDLDDIFLYINKRSPGGVRKTVVPEVRKAIDSKGEAVIVAAKRSQ